MADNVFWIRLKVGTFDGESFKRIKKAKIGGVSYRDKLTAVWFELLDLAGKSNADGFLINNNEIPYHSYEDIATMLDRDGKEIELCMGFYIAEKMVEIIDDAYMLTNFVKYQNQEGLEKIRAQNRERQAKFREKRRQCLLTAKNTNNVSDNVTSNVTPRYTLDKNTESNANSVTGNVTSRESSYSNSYSYSNVSKKESNKNNNITTTRARETMQSHEDIMIEFGCSSMVQDVLKEFLRHCYLNGVTKTNEELKNIIIRLDLCYGNDEQSKIDSLRRAISGGYVDIAENRK